MPPLAASGATASEPAPAPVAQAPQVPADAIPAAVSKPMSTKRKIAIALWGSSLLAGGGGVWFNQRGIDYKVNFNDAYAFHDEQGLRDAGKNMDKAFLYRGVGYGLSVGTLVAGLVLWFLPEGDNK